jgi:hypothetical protein
LKFSDILEERTASIIKLNINLYRLHPVIYITIYNLQDCHRQHNSIFTLETKLFYSPRDTSMVPY